MRKFASSSPCSEFFLFINLNRKCNFSSAGYVTGVDLLEGLSTYKSSSSSSSSNKFNGYNNRLMSTTATTSTQFQKDAIFSSSSMDATRPTSSTSSLNSNAATSSTNAVTVSSNNNTATASTTTPSPTTTTGKVKKELPPPITITPQAISRIKEILKGKEGEFVGVKVGGCNGYSYTMNYATQEDKTSGKYEVVKIQGEENSNLFVLVDKKAVFFLVGTSMHWEETELSSEFTFNNPNAKGSCGCGESFNI